MKRYSISYFVGQGIKGLWRNGLMSLIAIIVLMSCLIVMGSFAVIVYNININLDSLGAYNLIYCFVDTDLTEDATTRSELDYTINEASGIAPDESTESGAALVEAYNAVIELDNFSELDVAMTEISAVKAKVISAGDGIKYLADEDEMSAQTKYYSALQARMTIVEERIVTLNTFYSDLKAMDNVSSVDFTSKSGGLLEMKERYSEYPTVFENFKNNTLPDRFTIKYTENAKVSTLQYNLEHYNIKMYKVICHSDVAETMENIKSGVVLVLGWFLAVLFVISLFIIVNTIKLAVFSRSNEITIMRYVGATGWFIAMPFIVEGLIIGLVSSVSAFFIQKYIYGYVQEILTESFSNLITIVPFSSLSSYILFFFGGVGLITGVVGSFISMKKYLKV